MVPFIAPPISLQAFTWKAWSMVSIPSRAEPGKEKKRAGPEACHQPGRHGDGGRSQAPREHPLCKPHHHLIPLCLSFLPVKQDSKRACLHTVK